MIKKYSFFILISVFFFPKINIIPLTAGTYLKLDDLIVFLFVLIVFAKSRRQFIIEKFSLIMPFAVLIFIFFTSAILNTFNGNVQFFESIAFAIRPLEYFSYYYVGKRICINDGALIKFLKISTLFYALLVTLQYNGIVSVVSDFSPDRAMALTAGPYEFAIITAFLFIYFQHKKINYYYVALSCVLLLLTQSRITIFAVALIALVNLYKFKFRNNAIIFSIIFFVIFAINFNEDYNFGRFSDLFSMDSTFIINYIDKIPDIRSREEYFNYGYEVLLQSDFGEGDVSSLIRVYRWTLLLKYMLASPLTLIFGLGPSFASVALDGYYTRLLIESGVLGLFAFGYFIYKTLCIYSGNEMFIKFIYVMLITALFIDIFVSSKAMFIFWFLAGFYGSQKNYAEKEGKYE